jgi:tetratricopeptide (TPR) repeat protein
MFALATIIAAFRWTTLMAVEAAPAASPVLTLMTQSIVIWRYLALLALPVGQAIMHGVHWVRSPADPVAWLAIGGLIALLAMALRLRRVEPLVTFGIIWFFAALAPSSSVVALREGMAEHRVYFASAGLFLAVSALSARALARWVGPRARVVPGYICVVMVLIAILSALTLARNYVSRSPVRVWSEAVRRAPGMWEPHYALGDVLREADDCHAAIVEYQKVLELRPRHRDAHTNLGICFGRTGRLGEAEVSFRRALEIDPGFTRGYTNLGTVALLAGQPDRARDLFRKAIAMNPSSVLARMQLARVYESTYRDYAAAARLCGEVRAIDPKVPGAAECVERNRRLADAGEGGR